MSTSSKAIGAKTSASTPSLQPRPGSSSDVDSEVQSNKPLFLNFTAELAPFGASNKKQKTKKSNVYKVSGVNILNRNSVDSKTVLERLQRRRENHNFVERRRRDNINHTITTLSSLIPYCAEEGAKLNKGSILHMAVEYIRDMQDINSALSEENIRLGGSGSMELPSHRPNRRDSSVISELNTAVHSEEEDDEEDGEEHDDDESALPLMMCSSASTASTRSLQRRSRKGSVGQISAPSRKRSSSKAAQTAAEAGRGGVAGACKRPMLSISPPSSSTSTTPMSSRTNLSFSSTGHYHHGPLPVCMASPPLTTASTSTAPSANTSPMGMNSVTVGASFASTNVQSVPSAANLPHLPPPLMAKQSQQLLPPMMSSISSMTVNDASSLVNRQPAQSMPSSPNFRPAPTLQAAQPLMGVLRNSSVSSTSSIGSLPFFNTDVSSVRHNLQPPSDRHVHPVYGSTTAPHSLQSTPMMRPDPTLPDKFELPPLAFSGGSSAPYLSRMH
ncbi:hypothetical protein IWW37_001982 [Coemansia sp. RSA 2050]|nr:hypothetical protein IWW37_001982 [Coemansia sp. RSA 2050]